MSGSRTCEAPQAPGWQVESGHRGNLRNEQSHRAQRKSPLHRRVLMTFRRLRCLLSNSPSFFGPQQTGALLCGPKEGTKGKRFEFTTG